MKADREEEERRQKYGRVNSIQDTRLWKEEATELVRSERREREQAKAYMQPVQISFIEFMKWRGWDQRDVDELPDDAVYLEWRIYSLKLQYGISTG